MSVFRPRSPGGSLGSVLGALAMSVIAGVLLTAAITPVVAVSGYAASAAIDIFEKLPDHLDPSQLAQPSTLIAKTADGGEVELATFYDQNRKPVQWDAISQYVKDAAVAEEDPRFYTHGGVDVWAAGRAVLQNATSGGTESGASTISMQYVRNVLVQEAEAIPDEEERDAAYTAAMKQSMDRKLQEMRYAISIEKQYSKDQILLGYLNIALFGGQVYGIESAAQYFYSTNARDLSLAQAASLIAMVNEPGRLRIDLPENVEANQARRDKILGSMLQHGRITQAQHDEAIATPVEPQITSRDAGCAVAERNYGLGHFCDYVVRTIKNDPAFGNSATEREFKFRRGGFRILTSIDLDIQQAGRDAVAATVPAEIPGIKVGAASVSVEVHTGRVLGMVQNRPFSDDEAWVNENPAYTSINYNTDFEYGGSSGFQVGSTFKPITLAEWLRTGHSVRDTVNVNGRTVQLQSFRASCVDGGVYGYGPWTFSNDNLGVRGNQPVLTAIAQSVNGGLVSMQQKMDLCDTFDTAKKLGLHRAAKQMSDPTLNNYGTTELTRVPANVFGGTDEIAPITMASAYGAFASDGTVCTPVPIDQITGPDGAEVPFTGSACTSGVSPEVAAGVAYALEHTVTNGLARHARSPSGIPHLAKTGTTDDVIDNWTVGASSRVATATWVGNAEAFCFSETDCRRVSTQPFGRLMYADQVIWPAMMNVADAKYGGEAFPRPGGTSLRQTVQQIPDVRGKSYEEAEQALVAAGFAVSNGGDVDSSVPAGRVARSEPGSGGGAAPGSTVAVFISNGSMSVVPDGLTGASGDTARSRLNAQGFGSVTVKCETGNAGPPGSRTVVSVSPGSGEEAKRSNQVTVLVDCS